MNRLKTTDGFRISAAYTVANGNATILWLHGITVNKDEYLNFYKDGAELLKSKGIDSLRIDFRGHGKSSGTSLDFSVTGQMLDVEASIAYLRAIHDIELKGIHIVACSFGAPPAIFTALRYPDIIRSIILISPVLSYQRTFLIPETPWAKSVFNDDKFSQLATTNRLYVDDEFPISSRLVEEMRIIDPEAALTKVKQRVILIHGESDSMVPYQVSKSIAQKIRRIKFIPFANMDHGFTDFDDEQGDSAKSIANKNKIYKIIEEACR